MLKKITLTFLMSCFFYYNVSAQDTLHAMFYNLYRFPLEIPENREVILGNIFDTYLPDLFMVCELQTVDGANKILNTSFKNKDDSFARSTFYPSPNTSDPLQQLVFYNTRKLILLEEKILPTEVRDINYCKFLLNTKDKDEDSVHLHVFVAHLKSSTGAANVAARYKMTDTFAQALNQLPQDAYVLFAGDFNFYTASENGYQKIIDTANFIRMKDPANREGEWSDNAFYTDVHTQATRLYSSEFGTGGASGGLDDRFDFIMASENILQNNPKLTYITNTYKAYGNNGNCLDKSIKDTACNGDYSLALRIKLYYMSDHTPVVMQFKTDKKFEERKLPPLRIGQNNATQWGIWGSNIVHNRIGFIAPENTNGNISIFNTLGQLVLSISIKSPLTIADITTLPSGIYFAKCSGQIKVLKFLK